MSGRRLGFCGKWRAGDGKVTCCALCPLGDAPASTQHPQEATAAALGHDGQLVEQLRKVG